MPADRHKCSAHNTIRYSAWHLTTPNTPGLPIPVIGPDCCFVCHILEPTEPTGSGLHEPGNGYLKSCNRLHERGCPCRYSEYLHIRISLAMRTSFPSSLPNSTEKSFVDRNCFRRGQTTPSSSHDHFDTCNHTDLPFQPSPAAESLYV